jgi:hypothetical protein
MHALVDGDAGGAELPERLSSVRCPGTLGILKSADSHMHEEKPSRACS